MSRDTFGKFLLSSGHFSLSIRSLLESFQFFLPAIYAIALKSLERVEPYDRYYIYFQIQK